VIIALCSVVVLQSVSFIGSALSTQLCNLLFSL